MVEQVALDPKVRNRLLSECEGISNLVDWLDSIERRPGLAELDSKLISTEVNIPALKNCIGYAEDGYQRNVIKKTEHYELVAICWTPGQLTPIHDHVGSDCASNGSNFRYVSHGNKCHERCNGFCSCRKK